MVFWVGKNSIIKFLLGSRARFRHGQEVPLPNFLPLLVLCLESGVCSLVYRSRVYNASIRSLYWCIYKFTKWRTGSNVFSIYDLYKKVEIETEIYYIISISVSILII